MSNDKSGQNQTELEQLLHTFTVDQLRYIAVRPFVRTVTAAAEEIGIGRQTVYDWENKDDIDRAINLMMSDGVLVAREMLRRNLPKAIKVKTDGLDLSDNRLRQNVATEIIEWLLGKAPQRLKADVTTKRDEPSFNDWTPEEIRDFLRLVEKATGKSEEGTGDSESD